MTEELSNLINKSTRIKRGRKKVRVFFLSTGRSLTDEKREKAVVLKARELDVGELVVF